jgi:hypothetical protein
VHRRGAPYHFAQDPLHEIQQGVKYLHGTSSGRYAQRRVQTDGGRQARKVGCQRAVFCGLGDVSLERVATDPNRIYASQTSGWFGQLIQRSDDGGTTWHQPGTPLGEAASPGLPKVASNKFVYDGSAETGTPLTTHQFYDGTQHPWEFKRVWPLEPSLTDSDSVYAGVEDAALFRSTDGGQTWHELPGLRGHGTGPKWQPGGGGMCLHTIILDPSDPQRMYMQSRRPARFAPRMAAKPGSRSTAGFIPNTSPTRGLRLATACTTWRCTTPARTCCLCRSTGDVMRSKDAGESWQEVSGNLPTDFGFVIDVHAHEPETIYVVPIKSDSEHFVPDGKLRVFRSRAGGNEWEALTKGLPQSNGYVNVLRDAMAVDSLDKCGVYFDTTGRTGLCLRRCRRQLDADCP